MQSPGYDICKVLLVDTERCMKVSWMTRLMVTNIQTTLAYPMAVVCSVR